MKKVIFIFILFLFLACKDKPTEPPPAKPDISGTWEGKGSKSGINYTITVVLRQSANDTLVTGSGDITALFVKIPFSVTGGNDYPFVSLVFTSPDVNFGTGKYVGKFSSTDDNKIDGFATVPSFSINNEPLNIARIK